MFLLSKRQVHAALAGAAAACTYLAAAEIGSRRPVRVSGLFLLSSAALAGMVAQGLSGRASAKAYDVERRLNGFFNGGGRVGGTLYVGGDHHVSGNHYVTGQSVLNNASMAGNIAMNGNNIDGCTLMNTGGGNWDNDASNAGFHGNLFMNGHTLNMQGGHITNYVLGP